MSKHTHYDHNVGHDRFRLPVAPTDTTYKATQGVDVVYYLRLQSGDIKIGTSSRALERLGRHRRKLGADEVLAVEFGGRELERSRHKQFAALRVSRAEHFSPGQDLMDHIQSLREALGLSD